MEYIPRRAAAYEHPKHVLDGARSLLMLATAYRTEEPAEPAPGQGMIARYAWGTDYHDVIRERLHALADFHRELTPGAAVRGVVDTAPLLEREFAELAGLGWVGKNTLLLNRRLGSWFLLAALLTSETLAYDEPTTTGHCGTCRACIDACPTGAIVEPYRLDARKCISYLTIELRESIPPEQRDSIGQRIFGCDICQDVCPFNRRSPPTADPAFQPRPDSNPIDLAELLRMDDIGLPPSGSAAVPFCGPSGEVCFARPRMPWAIGRIANALPALVDGLHDTDLAVCEACAWALPDIPVRRIAGGVRKVVMRWASFADAVEFKLFAAYNQKPGLKPRMRTKPGKIPHERIGPA